MRSLRHRLRRVVQVAQRARRANTDAFKTRRCRRVPAQLSVALHWLRARSQGRRAQQNFVRGPKAATRFFHASTLLLVPVPHISPHLEAHWFLLHLRAVVLPRVPATVGMPDRSREVMTATAPRAPCYASGPHCSPRCTFFGRKPPRAHVIKLAVALPLPPPPHTLVGTQNTVCCSAVSWFRFWQRDHKGIFKRLRDGSHPISYWQRAPWAICSG